VYNLRWWGFGVIAGLSKDWGAAKIAEILIANGANVNKVSKDGTTPQ
jgi:hypothetical protein